MGRKGTLFLVCLLGYVLGAFAWIVKTPVAQFIENMGVSADTSQALLAGLFGSVVMVLAVLSFSFFTSSGSS